MNSISSLAAVGSIVLLVLQSQPTTSQNPVVDYKKWVKVTSKPHEIHSYTYLLCRSTSPEDLEKEKTNPHLSVTDMASLNNTKFIMVYVNKLGSVAMLQDKKPVYPVGSVIVKEKHPTATSSTPELLTVMRKREKGFNPTHGDWEYITLDGASQKVTSAGKLQNCQKCHERWKSTDYVSREYLSEVMRSKLK
ncbi:MAG: cytochrome P460 family protein [Chthonomonadales bacterium]